MSEKLFTSAAKVRDIANLPPMPLAAQRILGALEDEAIRISDLVDVINADPALSSRIIGIANSAYFGVSQKVYSINDAITRVLGTNNVFSIALSVVLAGPFRANKCPGFHLELYWSQAIKTAIFAQSLMLHVKAPEPGMQQKLYLCGLLHNIGLLVLAHAFPDKVTQVISIEQLEHSRNIAEVEERLIGIDRRRAGALLARKWHIPEDVCAVIEHHHDLDYRGEHWKLCLLIGISARWSEALSKHQPIEIDERNLAELGLNKEQAEHCIAKVQDKIEEIHKMALLLAVN